jgi:hypothetical protein
MRGTGKAPKPKSKPPPLEDKEQSRRFVETAKLLGSDGSENSFQRVFKKIVKVKPRRP